jgi:uracil-DNA glycosylase
MVRLFELESSWDRVLSDELQQPYIASLAAFVEKERAANIPVYPNRDLVFQAFRQTPYEAVNVVIMGQDPYHGIGQAHGLCFSVPQGVQPPPSLQNIFKEQVSDIGIRLPSHGCLISWAQQGVLLLNATLTVRQGEPMSHHGRGWERFTDAVISKLAERTDPVIFVLWGKSAQEKCKRIASMGQHSQHLVLTSPHPSPLSAHQGFFGCRHFSQINEFLRKKGKPLINWQL